MGCDVSLARSFGAVISGVAGQIVTVEVDHSQGLPSVGMVGLPDASVIEARHRARTALLNQKLNWPRGRVTISLAPAEVRKQGAGLDLAIAAGVLGATSQLSEGVLRETVFIGELGLDGSIRSTSAAFPCTVAASKAGFARVIVPFDDLAQCSAIQGIHVVSYSNITHLIAGLDSGQPSLVQPVNSTAKLDSIPDRPDMVDVLGHSEARAAIEISAVGGHNTLMIGAPGVGKTLLAERLPSILPNLTPQQSLEVTSIHALAGSFTGSHDNSAQLLTPPFVAPHHSSSLAAIVGSVHGSRVQPGAVTLAHRGVLFLDEAPEFPRNCMEALRQPLESGKLSLSRSTWSGSVPADFQLVMAMNPCPCGNALPGSRSQCVCSSLALRNYAQRISGPLRDRIDITLAMPIIKSQAVGDSSQTIAARVQEARERSRYRFRKFGWELNARIPPFALKGEFMPDSSAQSLLDDFQRKLGGLRGVHRALRVAWSIADLAGRARPHRDDVAWAFHLRASDWGIAS